MSSAYSSAASTAARDHSTLSEKVFVFVFRYRIISRNESLKRILSEVGTKIYKFRLLYSDTAVDHLKLILDGTCITKLPFY